MALIVSSYSGTRSIERTTNRTGQSGGSVGGNKKAGIWGGNVFMKVNNVGNHFTWRIPQKEPSLRQLFTMTTRNPVQYTRGSYAVTHSGTGI